MVTPRLFIDALIARGYGPFFGVPCSFLKPFINRIIDHDDLEYIAATNEGEALAMAVGSYLAGCRPVVMLQNSGLGNLVNPLTSLAHTFRVPVLLITTWRGQPGLEDEPQHEVMGAVTRDLYSLLRTPNGLFPSEDSEIGPRLDEAEAAMAQDGVPYALILPKGTVGPYELRGREPDRPAVVNPVRPRIPQSHIPPAERKAALALIADAVGDDVALIATTGLTGRELFEHRDRPTHLYLVGSMGCATSVGLGVCLGCPERPVVVVDGDGAALMRMEAMASVGHLQARNMVHIVLDNGTYESTGGQATISQSVSFPHIAAACGYRDACTVNSLESLRTELRRSMKEPGPRFIHMRIHSGQVVSVGRPTVTPPEVARRFRAAMMRA
jgi:phosphonopyruvate decarboxylase